MLDNLITIKQLVEENDDLTLQKYYRGIRCGVLPVIQIGPSHGYRITREMWRRFKRGEHIDERYFLKPARKSA